MTRRTHILLLLTILALAFLTRLALERFETEVGVDSVHYVLMGDNIAHGRSWDTWNTTGGRWMLPPTFPLLIALCRLLGAGLEWSGHLAAVIAGTLLLIPTYFLTRRLYGQGTALAAAWIAAFTPILVDYSVVILTECLFAAFVLTMMVFVHRAFSETGRASDSFWSGFWAGLAFLTKTFGIIMVPFLLIAYLVGRGGHSRTRPATQFILATLGFLILAVPYWVALHQYSGRWVIDGKGVGQENRIYARNLEEERQDPRYSGELTADGSDFLINVAPENVAPQVTKQELVLNFAHKYLQKLIRLYQDFPFTPTYPNNVLLLYLFPAMLLGLGLFSGQGRWKDRDSDRFLLYWLCPFVFGVPLIFVEVRYYIAVVPLLVPFMARGADEVARWIRERFNGRLGAPEGRAVTVVILAFIILAMPKLTYKVTHWKDSMVSYNPRKAAAEWLLQNGYHPSRIMEYGHSVSFYSGAQSILVPQGNLDDVIRIARKYDADILSLDEFFVLRADRRPQLDFLFDSQDPPPAGLERIYADERYPELHHYLYRIRAPEDTSGGGSHGY